MKTSSIVRYLYPQGVAVEVGLNHRRVVYFSLDQWINQGGE